MKTKNKMNNKYSVRFFSMRERLAIPFPENSYSSGCLVAMWKGELKNHMAYKALNYVPAIGYSSVFFHKTKDTRTRVQL